MSTDSISADGSFCEGFVSGCLVSAARPAWCVIAAFLAYLVRGQDACRQDFQPMPGSTVRCIFGLLQAPLHADRVAFIEFRQLVGGVTERNHIDETS